MRAITRVQSNSTGAHVRVSVMNPAPLVRGTPDCGADQQPERPCDVVGAVGDAKGLHARRGGRVAMYDSDGVP